MSSVLTRSYSWQLNSYRAQAVLELSPLLRNEARPIEGQIVNGMEIR